MSIFRFKQFVISHEKSAMKVGTDGVLLGSWVSCERANTILDVGCGSGLITLMLSQRNNKSNIRGVELDTLASEEARLNISNTIWKNRISIENISFQNFITETKFDLIVSNPPFFASNRSNSRRDIARHTNYLSFEELIKHSVRLLSPKGILGVIIPIESEKNFCKIAKSYHLYPNRTCYVRGNNFSNTKRVLMELSFSVTNIKISRLTIEKSRHNYTKEYVNLCKAFYMDM